MGRIDNLRTIKYGIVLNNTSLSILTISLRDEAARIEVSKVFLLSAPLGATLFYDIDDLPMHSSTFWVWLVLLL